MTILQYFITNRIFTAVLRTTTTPIRHDSSGRINLNIYRVGQKWGHRLMTIILSNLKQISKKISLEDSLINL